MTVLYWGSIKYFFGWSVKGLIKQNQKRVTVHSGLLWRSTNVWVFLQKPYAECWMWVKDMWGGRSHLILVCNFPDATFRRPNVLPENCQKSLFKNITALTLWKCESVSWVETIYSAKGSSNSYLWVVGVCEPVSFLSFLSLVWLGSLSTFRTHLGKNSEGLTNFQTCEQSRVLRGHPSTSNTNN